MTRRVPMTVLVPLDENSRHSPSLDKSSIERELQFEHIRFQLRECEAKLALTRSELEEKTRMCVTLDAALRRESARNGGNTRWSPKSMIPRVSGVSSYFGPGQALYDPIDDTEVRDANTWEQLRVNFLALLSDLSQTRSALRASEETLEAERQRRLRDVEKLHKMVSDKENEIRNYKTSFDAQLTRNTELEDKVAKLRSQLGSVQRAGSTTASLSTAPSTSRTFSPPVPEPAVNSFNRKYFPAQQSTISLASVGALPPQQSFPAPMPMYSPILMSRQILPQMSPSHPQTRIISSVHRH